MTLIFCLKFTNKCNINYWSSTHSTTEGPKLQTRFRWVKTDVGPDKWQTESLFHIETPLESRITNWHMQQPLYVYFCEKLKHQVFKKYKPVSWRPLGLVIHMMCIKGMWQNLKDRFLYGIKLKISHQSSSQSINNAQSLRSQPALSLQIYGGCWWW